MSVVAAEIAVSNPWPSAMTCLVRSLAENQNGYCRAYSSHGKLRCLSAAIAMFVHLTPVPASSGRSEFVNLRRTRTAYSSYPTPPLVARAIANHLKHSLKDKAAASTILDPSIEGAPILLECAHALAGKRVSLVGVDRSPAAIAASRALFSHACEKYPGVYLLPELILGDGIRAMEALGPIDAFVNNPPWGERDSHEWLEALTEKDYLGPREPYFEFVSRGLQTLKDGAPFGLVLPGQFATSRNAQKLRSRLTEDCAFTSITTLPRQCFPRATIRTLLLLGFKRRKGEIPRRVQVVYYPMTRRIRDRCEPSSRMVLQSRFLKADKPWFVCACFECKPLMRAKTIKLADVADVAIGIVPYKVGRGKPRQSQATVRARPFTFATPEPETVPIVRSGRIAPYHCDSPDEYIHIGPHLAYIGNHDKSRFRRRVFVRELCGRDGRLVAAPAPIGMLPRYGVFSIGLSGISENILCAVLNSDVIARYVRTSCDGLFRESFNRIRANDLRQMPLPESLASESPNRGSLAYELEQTVRRLRRRQDAKDMSALREAINTLVAEAYGQ